MARRRVRRRSPFIQSPMRGTCSRTKNVQCRRASDLAAHGHWPWHVRRCQFKRRRFAQLLTMTAVLWLAPVFLFLEIIQLIVSERYLGVKQIARNADPR